MVDWVRGVCCARRCRRGSRNNRLYLAHKREAIAAEEALKKFKLELMRALPKLMKRENGYRTRGTACEYFFAARCHKRVVVPTVGTAHQLTIRTTLD